MDSAQGKVESGENQESKRGRVRRLLFEPLEEMGFRKNGMVKAEDHKSKMDRLADNLAYMSDQSLGALCEMLRSKGQGRDRMFWPVPATIYGLAELVEPTPIEELPNLLSWFRSVEGPKAMKAGTLVETWIYFHKFKRPPQAAHAQIARDAADHQRKCERVRDRGASGRASAEELHWLDRYEKRLAYCEAIVLGKTEGKAA